MSKIGTIAILTIRNLVRSRILAVAAAGIFTVIIALPLVIKGDGTPGSQAGIFINYSFGLLMTVLSLVATWCGAGAISLEVSGRQIQLLVTKPLMSVQIWTGKLLGLMAVNLTLLALGGALILAALHLMIKPSAGDRNAQPVMRRDLMTVYTTVYPVRTDGKMSVPLAIGPGQRGFWRFDLSQRQVDTRNAILTFRFLPSPFSHQAPIAGAWRIFEGDDHDLLRKTSAFSPNMTSYLGMSGLPAHGVVNFEYLNLQTNPAVTVFAPENELSLLLPEGGFVSNLLRGLIMAFARLVFFTSLGLLAGALFTFPVAMLASSGLMVMAFSGGLVRQIAKHGLWPYIPAEQLSHGEVVLNEAARGLFRLVAVALPPMDRFDPLAFLPENLFITWNLAAQSVIVLCGFYSLVILLIGAACLSRREVGIPSP